MKIIRHEFGTIIDELGKIFNIIQLVSINFIKKNIMYLLLIILGPINNYFH